MRYFLEEILKKFVPPHIEKVYFSYEGNSELILSIPKKLSEWRVPNSFIVIIQDQDSHDCKQLKAQLLKLCESNSHNHTPLIRIACRELESWYFGDLKAVQAAYPSFNAKKYMGKKGYRNPDNIHKPSQRMKQIVKGFRKGRAAQEIPQHMDISNNKSKSFNNMISGIKNLVVHINSQNPKARQPR